MEIIVTPNQTKRGKVFADPIFYAARKLKLQTNEILFSLIYGGEIHSLLLKEEYLKWY